MTEIKFEETGKILLEGVDTVVDAVKVTYGPRGRSVVFNKNHMWPTVSNDTSSILQYIDLNDHYLGNAAEFVSETCLRTTNACGGGATTTAILIQKLLHEGFKNVSAGANPMVMRKAIIEATDKAVETIKTTSMQVGGEKEMRLVTKVACGDEEIGNMVVDAMTGTGDYGIVTVEDSDGTENYVDCVRGMQIQKGFISDYMITDPATGQAVLENPYILIVDEEITEFEKIIPIIEMVHKQNAELVIIARDVKDGALHGICHNIRRGVIKTLCVRAFGTAERVLEYLEDIAIFTGGEVISDTFGLSLDNVKLSQLGRAARVTSNKERTMITDGKGDPAAIRKRCEDIVALLQNPVSKFEHDRNQNRLATLSGGITRIKIGGYTKTEQLERKQKAEDALASLNAAMANGVVAGGGVAFLDAVGAVAKMYKEAPEGDYKTGVKTVLDALSAPLKQLAENVGLEGPAVLHNVMKVDAVGYGFNIETGEYGNMLDMGIADPTLTVCTALKNAAHCVALMLTSDAFVQKLDV